jgi:hypothetical protein
LSITEESILEILFTPAGPPRRSVENLNDDSMNRLTISEAQNRDGTIIEPVEDRPIDLKRLFDPNDSYDSLLVDPNQEFIPHFDRVT